MFRCEITGKLSAPLEKTNKVVVETREKVYFAKFRNEDTGKWEDIEIGRGSEIVRELTVSEAGLAEWEAMTPEQRHAFSHALKAA